MKIFILTAEPKNFVPVQLQEQAVKAGFESEIIDITKTFLLAGPESKVMYLKGEELVELPTQDVAYIPRMNEHHLIYKLNVLKQLEKQGAWLMNSSSSMELCNDKLASQVVMNAERVITPDSYIVTSVDMLDHVIKARGEKYPAIIKTIRGTQGIGVMKVDSEASLKSVAQACIAHGIELMIQDFLVHEESFRIIMTGEIMLAANRRGQPKEKNEFRTNAHLGSETEKYEPSEEELAIARKLVELFGCRFCAIDYVIIDKKIIVLEVNGSPGLENIQTNYSDEKNLAGCVIEYVKQQISKADDAPDLNEPDSNLIPVPFNELTTQSPIDVVKDIQQVNQQEPLGDVEKIIIARLADEGMDARIDTGAAYCSLHCDDVQQNDATVKFTRGGITYKVPVTRTIKIRNAHGTASRAMIKLDVIVRGVRFNQVEMTITPRSSMKYEMLIGRNLLSLLGLPIIVPASDERDPDLPPSEVEEE